MSGFPPSSPAGRCHQSGFSPSGGTIGNLSTRDVADGMMGLMSSGFLPSASAGGWSQSGFPSSGTKNGGGLCTEDGKWKSNRVGGAHGTGKAPFPHQQGKPVGRNLGTPSSPLPMKGTGEKAGGLRMERGRGSGFPPFPPREKKNGNGERPKNLLTPCTERYTKKKNGVNSTATKTGTHTGGQPSGRPSQ